MFWNDDEDPIGDLYTRWKNLSDEEKAEMDREQKDDRNRMKDHPLHKKSIEILDIVNTIVDSIPEEERAMHSPMVESAMMLAPKFAGAFDTDSWLLAMQNAAIMREHAQYIATGTYGFNMFGDGEVDSCYVELLRKEMKEYKRLFNEWMDEVHAMPFD